MRPNEHQFLIKVLRGDMAAVHFCECLFRISQTWDDLIDKDKKISDDDINRMMWEALVVLPGNPFYQKWHHELHPLMKVFASDWMDATTMERIKDDHLRRIAFVLRSSVSNIILHCAYLIGGYDWMKEVSLDIRRHIYEDNFEDYLKALGR